MSYPTGGENPLGSVEVVHHHPGAYGNDGENPFSSMKTMPAWWDDRYEEWRRIENRRCCAHLRLPRFGFPKIDGNGDCFYESVVYVLSRAGVRDPETGRVPTVADLRNVVADNIERDQLEHYRILADLASQTFEATDFDWTLAARDAGALKTVRSLRRYARRCGKDHGADKCLWADAHAIRVVGERLRVEILLIDMERDRAACPYRRIHRVDPPSSRRGYIVVLLRRRHYRPLVERVEARVVVGDDEDDDEDEEGGRADARAGGGARTTTTRGFWSTEADVPNVVRALWGIVGPNDLLRWDYPYSTDEQGSTNGTVAAAAMEGLRITQPVVAAHPRITTTTAAVRRC